MALGFEIGVTVLLLAVGGWIIAVRQTFAAVMGFIVYGMLLAIVWVRLAAVDVAMTEAAIGSGLTGVLLIGAASRLQPIENDMTARPGKLFRSAAAVLSAAVGIAIAVAFLLLPEPAPTLAPEIAANAAATGMDNPVTNVLMAFRAVDTLLEKVVLLIALTGVWSLTEDSEWGGRPGLRHSTDTNSTLAFLARLLPPVGIVIAIHILWTGANAPGGAFQAGTILAAMWLLVLMAGLADAPHTKSPRLRLALVAGPLVFLAIGLGGLVLGEGFLTYPEAFAKPLILVIEFAMVLTIAATLGLLVVGPPQRDGHR